MHPVQKENHANASGRPVEQSISCNSKEEKQLKSRDTTSFVASESGTPDMSSGPFQMAESTFVVSLFSVVLSSIFE